MRRPTRRLGARNVSIGVATAALLVGAALLALLALDGGDDQGSTQPRERRAAFVLFAADLETGDFTQFEDLEAAPHELTIVTSPVRAGRHAARALVRKGEEDVGGSRYRAEATNNGAGGANQERERWFGFSSLLPEDWQIVDDGSDVLFQIHELPDACEDPRSPPLALRVVGDRLEWQVKWDPQRCTEEGGAGPETIASAPLVRGRWIDWVVHVRWSYGPDGLAEVWQDGEKVATYHGPNAYNDGRPMYLKVGVYRSGGPWPAALPRRVAYFDEFRMAGARGAYADVAPGGTA